MSVQKRAFVTLGTDYDDYSTHNDNLKAWLEDPVSNTIAKQTDASESLRAASSDISRSGLDSISRTTPLQMVRQTARRENRNARLSKQLKFLQ